MVAGGGLFSVYDSTMFSLKYRRYVENSPFGLWLLVVQCIQYFSLWREGQVPNGEILDESVRSMLRKGGMSKRSWREWSKLSSAHSWTHEVARSTRFVRYVTLSGLRPDLRVITSCIATSTIIIIVHQVIVTCYIDLSLLVRSNSRVGVSPVYSQDQELSLVVYGEKSVNNIA